MIKHSELVFGIPTQRSKSVEKHPKESVLTMLAAGDKGTARKIDVNTCAANLLGFKLDGKDTVNFAFNMEDGKKVVYFANTTLIENPSNVRLTKQATFSNKKMYDYLAKVFELDTAVENELLISDISDNIGKITVLTNVVEDLPIEVAEDTTDTVEEAVVLDAGTDSEENSLDY